jgi:hypothetical protein
MLTPTPVVPYYCSEVRIDVQDVSKKVEVVHRDKRATMTIKTKPLTTMDLPRTATPCQMTSNRTTELLLPAELEPIGSLNCVLVVLQRSQPRKRQPGARMISTTLILDYTDV